jgi:D-aspartate ligase
MTTGPNEGSGPLGVVMGDVDVVRALGVAGIASAFFGFDEDAARFSRHVRVTLPWIDHWERQEELAGMLLAFAREQDEAPVLFPQTDATLLMASRRRDRLAEGLRFVLAGHDLVEQLVDKARFQALAAERGLPVPPAQRLRPVAGAPPPALEVPFPIVIKPLTRTPGWTGLAGASKALHVMDGDDFAAAWPALSALPTELLAQQLIAGPESRIESFHVYVDATGAIAGSFTGRKIRTFPLDYGHSTAVEIVALPDVAELGREVVERLGLTGVAKLDFKRDGGGRLHLLEINPRFNLWHYPGAIAGVNLPALVYADLTRRERPPVAAHPRHVAWVDPLQDLRAARAAGVAPLAWLRFLARCRAVCGLAWADPAPFLRGKLWGAVRRRAVSRFRAGRAAPTARPGPGGTPGSSA